jgi:4-alpha-glucanotransferase
VSNFTPDRKIAGALVPVFALRGEQDLGVGDTDALKEFVRWSARHGMHAVQILPINETGADHSPYNILSSMAIEPCTLATYPHSMVDLSAADFKRITAAHDAGTLTGGRVAYAPVKALKFDLLRAAFLKFSRRAGAARLADFEAFRDAQHSWIESYATFRALVETHGTEVTGEWPEAHRSPNGTQDWIAMLSDSDRENFEDEVTFRIYIQWIAYDQWDGVRQTCSDCDVALIGDIPVGVSIYSADVWQEPEIFDLERSCGAPPERVFAADPFTAKWGQNWGFPLYNWFAMSRDNFAWWRRRLRMMRQMFDLTRVDHALGFFRIYSFPWRPELNAEFLPLSEEEAAAKTGGALPGFVPQDDSTPENQDKNRRHGETLFKLFLDESDPHCLIAEDLGEVAPYVRPVLAQLEIPGFKIPQWERELDGSYKPGASYSRLSLATYATHDHPPVKAFWDEWFTATQSESTEAAAHALFEMKQLVAFADRNDVELPRPFDGEVHLATMQGLLASNAWLVIPMITDILGIDDRFNVPGATGDQNWSARLEVSVNQLDETFAPPLARFQKALVASGR